MRTRPARTDVSSAVDPDAHLPASALSSGEFVITPEQLARIGDRVIARMKDIVQEFFSTEPADRERAEAAIIAYHKANHLPVKPRFVWCKSPQTAIVMGKILSDLHENTTPRMPTKSSHRTSRGAKIHFPPFERTVDWAPVQAQVEANARRTATLVRDLTPDRFSWSAGMTNIVAQVKAALQTNPDTTLYSEEGGNGKDSELIERALNNTEPHLSKIELEPTEFGRRLKLQSHWLGNHIVDNRVDGIRTELRRSCGWVWDYGTHVLLCERPTEIHREQIGDRFSNIRLHNTEGPGIAWGDGFGVYFIHGVKVPDYIVTNPKLISTYKINRELNQEVRRVMIDRYKFGQDPSGIAAYVIDSGAKRIDHDERWGTLWRFRQAASVRRIGWWEEEEDIVMLEVVNRSPEPDGSFKHYYLRVPPTITRSHEAAAWTFGFTEAELDLYNPLQET